MHRYRIVAQISLILSVLNLVLAAPIIVQEIHDMRHAWMTCLRPIPGPGRDGISVAFVLLAFVLLGRVDVLGLSCPVSVVGFVGFRQFVVVGQAAASESGPSRVIA